MAATDEPTLDIDTRKKQLLDLSKNLNILLEREAKFGGNAPLELLNQIDDHRRAIDLIQQVLGGDLTGDELDEALKPLLLALRDGQVINITAETYVAGDLIQNITHILSAAEEAAQAQEIATRRLAEGVRDYLHRLQYIITAEPETEAQRLAQPTFENALDAAVALAGKGDSEATKTKFEEAMELAGSLNSAEGWHSLCVGYASRFRENGPRSV